jgi:hypothetical protein
LQCCNAFQRGKFSARRAASSMMHNIGLTQIAAPQMQIGKWGRGWSQHGSTEWVRVCTSSYYRTSLYGFTFHTDFHSCAFNFVSSDNICPNFR